MKLDFRRRGLVWRKLETFLRTGLPLADAVGLMLEQSASPRERLWLESLKSRLESGAALSESAPGLECSERGLLYAAERTGELRAAVGALADRAEQRQLQLAQLRSALTYPAIVAVVCVGLWVLLTTVVMPRFGALFVSLGVGEDLPGLTKAIMAISGWFGSGGWALAVLALGGLVWLLGRVSKMGWMKVPFLGKPFRDEFCARFFSTLGLLSGHGVALNEAVDWALQTAGCPPLFADAVGRDLSSGEELSRVMGRLGAFPREDLEVMALAQRTAAISETSTRLGRIHQERYEIGMRGLLGVVEPALVVVMALSVAVLVGALFAPLLPLISRLSEGV